jgi:hypothetical protein
MDTGKNSSNNHYFIYALGVICLFNILSSELSQKNNEVHLDSNQLETISDNNQVTNYLI